MTRAGGDPYAYICPKCGAAPRSSCVKVTVVGAPVMVGRVHPERNARANRSKP